MERATFPAVTAAFDLAEAHALLERTPAVLAAWLDGLPESLLSANEGPDTWCAFDVLGHLVDGERTDWIPRLRTILEHGESWPFEQFNRTQHLERPTESLDDRLEEFTELRADNLRALDALDLGPAQLARRGTHPELGTVTAAQLLATWVVHDQDHLFQIARILARRFGGAVGPWRAYLRILRLPDRV